MLITSKLPIWHLSRKIVRIESTKKGAAIEKSRTVIGQKRIDERASFVYNLWAVHELLLSTEGGVRSFDKSDFIKQIDVRRAEKVLQKIQKKCFPLHVREVFLPNSNACSSPARSLKFCNARARVVCVILAHAASRVTFHGYFELTSTKQYSTKFFRS